MSKNLSNFYNILERKYKYPLNKLNYENNNIHRIISCLIN